MKKDYTKIYAVMCGWSSDIHSDVIPYAYFSTEDKAETFILKSKLLDLVTEDNGYQVYVEEITIDDKEDV